MLVRECQGHRVFQASTLFAAFGRGVSDQSPLGQDRCSLLAPQLAKARQAGDVMAVSFHINGAGGGGHAVGNFVVTSGLCQHPHQVANMLAGPASPGQHTAEH